MICSVAGDRLMVDGRAAPFAASPHVGGRIEPTLIVLHDTAGGLDASGSISWLCNPRSKVSAHFVVARDGVRDTTRAAASQ